MKERELTTEQRIRGLESLVEMAKLRVAQLEDERDALKAENERLRSFSETKGEVIESGHRLLLKAQKERDTLKAAWQEEAKAYEEKKAERDALKAEVRETWEPLYRFVMESRYARNFAVPSGVLDRARQILSNLEEK